MNYENIQWTFEDGELTLTGKGSIPNYTGKIAPWEEVKSQIQTLCIERGITRIGAHAFCGCTALETIFLADTVSQIGFCAFKDCTALVEVDTLRTFAHRLESAAEPADGIILMGLQAFRGTPWQAENYGDFYMHGSTLVEYLGSSRVVTVPEGTQIIGSRAFENQDVAQVTFPESLKRICAYAFMNAPVTALVLPQGLEEVEDYAFANTTQLEQLLCRGSSTRIGAEAFHGSALPAERRPMPKKEAPAPKAAATPAPKAAGKTASRQVSRPVNTADAETITVGGAVLAIQEDTLIAVSGQEAALVLPAGITRIRPAVFRGCDWLESITLPEGMKKLGSYAFAECVNLQQVQLPQSLTQIEEGAFFGCTALNQIRLSAKFKTIHPKTFAQCTSLKAFNLPLGLATIKESAFAGCTALEKVFLPDKVTQVDAMAFFGCTNLLRLQLSDNLKTLGQSAFAGCTALTRVTIPAALEEMGEQAFRGCGLTEVEIRSASRGKAPLLIPEAAFALCPNLEKVHFTTDNYTLAATAFGGTPWGDAQNTQ